MQCLTFANFYPNAQKVPKERHALRGRATFGPVGTQRPPLFAGTCFPEGRVRGRDALEGTGPWRRPEKRLDVRSEEVAKAVGGSYRRLQMPLKLALAVRETAAGHRLGALEGEGGTSPHSNASLVSGPPQRKPQLVCMT